MIMILLISLKCETVGPGRAGDHQCKSGIPAERDAEIGGGTGSMVWGCTKKVNGRSSREYEREGIGFIYLSFISFKKLVPNTYRVRITFSINDKEK